MDLCSKLSENSAEGGGMINQSKQLDSTDVSALMDESSRVFSPQSVKQHVSLDVFLGGQLILLRFFFLLFGAKLILLCNALFWTYLGRCLLRSIAL